jgi:polar amino acid transport system ATP-binding protein
MRLSLRGIAKSFAGRAAVGPLSLDVDGPRALVLLGPSGCGKSTLLRIIGGLEPPDAGTLDLDGTPLPTREADLQRYRAAIGTVFQSFNLFPHLSALVNITLPLEKVHGLTPAAALARAEEQLRRFRLLDHASKRPAELSGGQRQRVAIARALAIQPRLLLFDEPTSALDPEMTAEVLEVIAELRAEGRDLILVTHQIAFAREVADHALFLRDGQIVESRAAKELFDEPREASTRDFLERVLRY